MKTNIIPFIGFLILLSMKAKSQSTSIITLENALPNNLKTWAELIDYPDLSPTSTELKPALIIFPGGGYSHLAKDHEGIQVAEKYTKAGFKSFILHYRHTKDNPHPIPLSDAVAAIKYIRNHAEVYNIDPNKIGILGFSAGGHLASTLATHFSSNKEGVSARPDFALLIYPVITFKDEYTHTGSRNNLLNGAVSIESIENLSNESHVDSTTPPTFLVHTFEDKAVSSMNSVLYYQALVRNNVQSELHIFQKGRHGLGFGEGTNGFEKWYELSLLWLIENNIIEHK